MHHKIVYNKNEFRPGSTVAVVPPQKYFENPWYSTHSSNWSLRSISTHGCLQGPLNHGVYTFRLFKKLTKCFLYPVPHLVNSWAKSRYNIVEHEYASQAYKTADQVKFFIERCCDNNIIPLYMEEELRSQKSTNPELDRYGNYAGSEYSHLFHQCYPELNVDK
jgi:hypothetical protein